MKLADIYRKHQRSAHELIAEHAGGKRVIIEGLRPEDPEGGCMATGTPEALFGRDDDGNHWWHAPKGFDDEDGSWSFVRRDRDPYIARCIDSDISGVTQGKEYTVVRRKSGHVKLVNDRGDKSTYSEKHFIIRDDHYTD